jgi:hypothetical protein
MARQRAYASNAEKMRAYRERLKSVQTQVKIRHPRPLSRPRRLEALLSEAEDLLSSYTDWQEALPESLQGSGQGERLQETIDALQQVVELLEGIDLPRGFGRD